MYARRRGGETLRLEQVPKSVTIVVISGRFYSETLQVEQKQIRSTTCFKRTPSVKLRLSTFENAIDRPFRENTMARCRDPAFGVQAFGILAPKHCTEILDLELEHD